MRRVGRAATLRCPRCGGRGLFRWWVVMADTCPRCGLRFEAHEGYWLGAVAINTIVTIAVFVATLVIGMAVTWPEVPWGWLLAVTIGVNLVFPILFHPFSRTLWVALETSLADVDR